MIIKWIIGLTHCVTFMWNRHNLTAANCCYPGGTFWYPLCKHISVGLSCVLVFRRKHLLENWHHYLACMVFPGF